MKAPDLVFDVVDRLQKIDATSVEIAKRAGVPESWLKMFRRGKIPNPGIRQFQRIVTYLIVAEDAGKAQTTPRKTAQKRVAAM